MKAIKRRISSVTTTKQVMKAMDMVAAAKLQKAKGQLDAARPFVDEMVRAIDEVKNVQDAIESQYFKQREVKNSAFVVIAGDSGLCGSYNANVLTKALPLMEGKNEKIIAIGTRGRDFFKRNKKNIHESFSISETLTFDEARKVCSLLLFMYHNGEIDEIYVAYTKYVSALSQVPHLIRVLPVSPDPETQTASIRMQFESGAEEYLESAIPMYLKAIIYGALIESFTSEQAARMVNMDSAVNNAGELIDDLTLLRNRKRQALITQEINEIVNGVNTLKSKR